MKVLKCEARGNAPGCAVCVHADRHTVYGQLKAESYSTEGDRRCNQSFYCVSLNVHVHCEEVR